MGMTRNKINTVLENTIYQRGQILSWKLEQKRQLIAEYNIGVIINFWPKLDSDMSDLPCWYWYMPSESEEMVSDQMLYMARVTAHIINVTGKAALILCEAGMTRSVFFAALVLSKFSSVNVLEQINVAIPNNRMKPYMIEYLENLSDNQCERNKRIR